MPRDKVPKPKYVAEGFDDDVKGILNEFNLMNSVEFPDFAEIWKKHNFSLVFMGRPDQIENTEFTNEIFRVTSQYLTSPSFYQKVGAAYILYALFRNQISDPPVKIRLEINQWRVIKNLRMEATLKAFRTLHYVIDYLIKNAFIYVAHQMLRGPVIGTQEISKHSEAVSNLRSSYKSDIMGYSVSNNLEAIRNLHIQYLEEKKNLSSDKLNMDESSDVYDKFIQDIKTIVKPATKSTNKETLGSRRAHLKALSFLRRTQDRLRNDSDEEQNEVEEKEEKVKIKSQFKKKKGKKKKSGKGKRTPIDQRRVGRPSKKPKPQLKHESASESSDDDVDITHLLSQQAEFYLPPIEDDYKKCRTRREPYYKHSPKREENLSDPDNPV